MADTEQSGLAKAFRNKTLVIGVSCLIMLCLIFSAFFVLKMLLKDDGGRRKRQIQRVTLVKPPPPPKIKEKPPEPEIEKKEEIVEPEPEETPPEDNASDEPPPGEELGLDADGSGAGDSFGLKANKGGRSLIGGGGGGSSLMRRYSWYTRILQDEIREKVNKYLEDIETLPGGKHRMLLKLKLDDSGGMISYAISKSSGDTEIDDAVKKALAGFRVSEAPPEEMPKTIKIKVTFKS